MCRNGLVDRLITCKAPATLGARIGYQILKKGGESVGVINFVLITQWVQMIVPTYKEIASVLD